VEDNCANEAGDDNTHTLSQSSEVSFEVFHRIPDHIDEEQCYQHSLTESCYEHVNGNHRAARIAFFVNFDHFGLPLDVALFVLVDLVFLVKLVVIFGQGGHQIASLWGPSGQVRLLGLVCASL